MGEVEERPGTYAGWAMSVGVGTVEDLEERMVGVTARVGEVRGCGKEGGAGRCIRGKIECSGKLNEDGWSDRVH